MPAAGGPSRPLAATPDGQPRLIGWVARWQPVCWWAKQRRRGTRAGAARERRRGRGARRRPDLDDAAETLNRSGMVAGLRRAGRRSRARALCGARQHPAGRREAGLGATGARRRRSGREGSHHVEIDRRPGHRGPPHLPGRLSALAPACRCCWSSTAGRRASSRAVSSARPAPIRWRPLPPRGYAVLRVNPRGSSGYGKEFRHANRGDWGGGDYRDLMSGVDHVIAMGVADPDRLGVMGWSYGGFMTSWVVTQTKRFKAASAGAAGDQPHELHRRHRHSRLRPRLLRRRVLGRRRQVWRTHSAMFNVKGVRRRRSSSTARPTTACRSRRATSSTTPSSGRA